MDTTDKQTIYKSGGQYYEIHSRELLDKGYVITSETPEYAIFELTPTIAEAPGGTGYEPV